MSKNKNIMDKNMAAILIQNAAYMMFYKKYGLNWKNNLLNYNDDLDYYCYVNNIVDPWQDYINYYKKEN